MYHTVKYAADASAVGITVATIQGWLPSVAAVLSIIYLSIQIASAFSKWIEKREYARGPRGRQGLQGEPGKAAEMEVKAIPLPDEKAVVVKITPKSDGS
jgi:hypothetical protein